MALYLVNWLATGAALLAAGLALASAFRVDARSRAVFFGLYGAAVFVFPGRSTCSRSRATRRSG